MKIGTFIFVASFVLWVLYVWVMVWKAKAERDPKRKWLAYLLGYPAAMIGIVIDVAYNLTIACLIFWDSPRELTLTSRLQRYIQQKVGYGRLDVYRFRLAYWICRRLLHPWDGDHCWKVDPVLPL